MKNNCIELYPVYTFQKIINLLEMRGYIIDELDKLSSIQLEYLNRCFDNLIKKYNINTNLNNKNLMIIGQYFPNKGAIYITWNKRKIKYAQAIKLLEDFYNSN